MNAHLQKTLQQFLKEALALAKQLVHDVIRGKPLTQQCFPSMQQVLTEHIVEDAYHLQVSWGSPDCGICQVTRQSC